MLRKWHRQTSAKNISQQPDSKHRRRKFLPFFIFLLSVINHANCIETDTQLVCVPVGMVKVKRNTRGRFLQSFLTTLNIKPISTCTGIDISIAWEICVVVVVAVRGVVLCKAHYIKNIFVYDEAIRIESKFFN